VVPGQRIEVRASLTNRGTVDIEGADVSLVAGAAGWNIEKTGTAPARLAFNESARHLFTVAVPPDAALSRPYYERESIAQSRYAVLDASQLFRPAADAVLTARARYRVAGVPVEIRSTVVRREAHLPYGEEVRELMIVPAVAVNVSPRTAIIPASGPTKTVDVRVEVLNNVASGGAGRLALRLPSGWTSSPAGVNFTFAHAGERTSYTFKVSASSISDRAQRIEAVGTVAGRDYSQGYDVIEHRDLETRYLYHPATTDVRGVDVAVAPNLNVGYVMGIGDDVPAGIAQLGAAVTLLGEQELATGNLRQFDAIVTGTRAYAVRDDLKTYNRRLLDYVKDGGNLIVLYNTQELVPNDFAPYPGQLTARAEEVSEEDSPVDVLAPSHRALAWPNRITKADFDGWVEQRGSKFFSEWDPAYTAIIATHDTGQAWQKGGWLTADYGRGHYTYFAYALHRQLPYGVAGAYRLLANLLSLGK
jgi:hypothetical protein